MFNLYKFLTAYLTTLPVVYTAWGPNVFRIHKSILRVFPACSLSKTEWRLKQREGSLFYWTT
jgi:hypothetical protein